MARIGIGGFQHETNTFSEQAATLEDFVLGGGWPGILEGEAVLATTLQMNLPIAGMAEELARLGHTVVPLVWAAATPSGRVESRAFEDITARFLTACERAGPLDGLLLDLHGAMATDIHDDAEGEFLARLRHTLGSELPLVATLDFHANVSGRMFDLSDGLVVYRTYPHIDMRQTGERAARFLDRQLRSGRRPFKVWQRVDYLVTLPNQSTLAQPAKGIVDELTAMEQTQGLWSLSWAGGFPLADVPDAGQTVLAYGDHHAAAVSAVGTLCSRLFAAEPEFGSKIWGDQEAVAWAMSELPNAHGPIILADTQDNPGGGGSSDTTGLLRCLIDAKAKNAVVAVVVDPATAQAAHAAGRGVAIDVQLGGRAALPAERLGEPWCGEAVVEQLGDGQFTGSGPMWGGSPIDLGPTALLRIGDVRVVVASRKMQAADQAIFAHVGVDPSATSILVLKSSVHFRADFQAMAHRVLVVASPGLVTARLEDLPYQHLRHGVRIAGAVAPRADQPKFCGNSRSIG